MTEGKKKLLALEEEGRYVFHGSPVPNMGVLEPRQSMHAHDRSKPMEMRPDGGPAVSASPYVDIAIFVAIVNRKNISGSFASGYGGSSKEDLDFRLSPKKARGEVYDNKKGYVYVFDKKDFEPYYREIEKRIKDGDGVMEWRSYHAVKPVAIIEVSSEDLPPEKDVRHAEI